MTQRSLRENTGNHWLQRVLEKNVRVSLKLMGIGSGGEAANSGEYVALRSLKQAGRESPCIFDVGANKGQFLKLAYRELHQSAFSIHCFEPSGAAFRALKDASPSDDRINLNNAGLGKGPSNATLYFDSEASGLASLTKRRLDHRDIQFDSQEKVRIDSLDNYCEESAVKHIDLLKIDVEGHEMDVLSGGIGMIERGAVDMVAFEFGGCNIDTRTYFQDFWYFFTNLNFSISRVTPAGRLHRILKYRESHEQFLTTNFVAIRNG